MDEIANAIAQILSLPVRLVNRIMESLPPPPGAENAGGAQAAGPFPLPPPPPFMQGMGRPLPPFPPPLPFQAPASVGGYENDEHVEFYRDPDTNRMSGYSIKRRARLS